MNKTVKKCEMRLHGDFILQMMEKYFPETGIYIKDTIRSVDPKTFLPIVVMRCEKHTIVLHYKNIVLDDLKDKKLSITADDVEVFRDKDYPDVYYIVEKGSSFIEQVVKGN